jgi:hypothetical protein
MRPDGHAASLTPELTEARMEAQREGRGEGRLDCRAAQTVLEAQIAPIAASTTKMMPIPAQESISFFIVQPPERRTDAVHPRGEVPR